MKSILSRIRQGHHTIRFPNGEPPLLPDRFRGRPVINAERCNECNACVEACPTSAIVLGEHKTIDLGKCLFCGACQDACTENAIHYEKEYRLSTSARDDLINGADPIRLADSMSDALRRILGRSLKLRVVSAGGCNACEADVNVLNTIGWDLGRFGIQMVASPRHADGILVTGPVTETMRLALRKTYDAIPDPKIVIAVGACAISGGIYANHPEQQNGVTNLFPVDLYIPGCPPHPLTILDGLLRFLGIVTVQEDKSVE